MLSTLVLLRMSPCFTGWWLIGILDKILDKESKGAALGGLVRFFLQDKNQQICENATERAGAVCRNAKAALFPTFKKS